MVPDFDKAAAWTVEQLQDDKRWIFLVAEDHGRQFADAVKRAYAIREDYINRGDTIDSSDEGFTDNYADYEKSLITTSAEHANDTKDAQTKYDKSASKAFKKHEVDQAKNRYEYEVGNIDYDTFQERGGDRWESYLDERNSAEQTHIRDMGATRSKFATDTATTGADYVDADGQSRLDLVTSLNGADAESSTKHFNLSMDHSAAQSSISATARGGRQGHEVSLLSGIHQQRYGHQANQLATASTSPAFQSAVKDSSAWAGSALRCLP